MHISMARLSSIDKAADSKKGEKGLVVTEDDESSEASSVTNGDNYTEYTVSEDEEEDDEEDEDSIDDESIDDDSVDEDSVDDGTSTGDSVNDSTTDSAGDVGNNADKADRAQHNVDNVGDETLGNESISASLKTADTIAEDDASDNDFVPSASTTHGSNVGLSSAAIRENRQKGHDHEKMPIDFDEARYIIQAAMPDDTLPPSVGAKSMIDPQMTISNPFAEDAQERLDKAMAEQAAANKARSAALSTLAESQRAASAKADQMNDSEYDQILQRMVAQNRRLNQDPKAMRRSARGIGKLRASFERLQMSRAHNPAEAEGLGGGSEEFGVGSAKDAAELGDGSAESIDWEFWGNLIKGASMLTDYSNVLATSPIELSKAIYAGIPAALRGMMWQLLSSSKDDDLELQYAKYLTLPCPSDRAIRRDLSRTFPDQDYFKEAQGRGQESLYNVVKAYSLFDPECGYCQGMQFVVGPLLLNMPDEEAFSTFVRLMHNYDLRGHFIRSSKLTSQYAFAPAAAVPI